MTKQAVHKAIGRGFIPGSYVQIKATGKIIKIIDYPDLSNNILLEDDTTIFLDLVTPVETKPCRCRHKYFLGKVLAFPSIDKQSKIYHKDGDFCIECPFCYRVYFWNGIDWTDSDNNKLEVFDVY